jgi:hypothetical protein
LNNRLTSLVGVFILITCLGTSLMTGCQNTPAIGKIVQQAPVTAVVHEIEKSKEAQPSGIVYREVHSIEKLLAGNNVLLIAFLDDTTISNTAIPFVETMADRFSGRLLVIRVNPDASGDDTGLIELESLLQVRDYPYFVLIQEAKQKEAFSEYNEKTEQKIIEAVYSLLS